jgi:hypothetical protein
VLPYSVATAAQGRWPRTDAFIVNIFSGLQNKYVDIEVGCTIIIWQLLSKQKLTAKDRKKTTVHVGNRS